MTQNLTKHQLNIKSHLSKLFPNDEKSQKILKKHTSSSNAISNLQYSNSSIDFNRNATKIKLDRIVEKLEVNSEEEKCEILKLLLKKLDSAILTDSCVPKTVYLILQTAKREFLHGDFELNLPDRRVRDKVFEFSDDESGESYHAFEEGLSDWDDELDDDEMDDNAGIEPKQDKTKIKTNSENFDKNEDSKNNSFDSESSEFVIEPSPFQLKNYPSPNKILVTESDICMNILSMLMSGGRGLSSLYTTGFQLFKHATSDTASEITALDFKTTSYQVSHITDGCINTMLKKFLPPINVIKHVLTFCEKIRKSPWACNRYVSEFCAILNDEYNLIHGHLVECYTNIQVNPTCRQANLLRLHHFARKVMKKLDGLWQGAGRTAFLGEKSARLSHQQRFGLILNEIYLKEFQQKIEVDALAGTRVQDFYNVEQFHENNFFDEVLEDFKNHDSRAKNDEMRDDDLKNEKLLRMFSLCQASIQQILHGTANPRVRPVMLDVHLPGHFWSTIRSKITETSHSTSNLNQTLFLNDEETEQQTRDNNFVELMDSKLRGIASDLKIAAEYAKLGHQLKLRMPNFDYLEEFTDIEMAGKLSRKLKIDVTDLVWSSLKQDLVKDFKVFHDFYFARNGLLLDDIIRDTQSDNNCNLDLVQVLFNDWEVVFTGGTIQVVSPEEQSTNDFEKTLKNYDFLRKMKHKWTVSLLDFSEKWPMCLFVNDFHKRAMQTILNLIVSLKQCLGDLNGFVPKVEDSKDSQRLHVLKFRFVNMMNGILNYITYGVIEPKLQQFSRDMEGLSDPLVAYCAHDEMISKMCKDLAILTPEISDNNSFSGSTLIADNSDNSSVRNDSTIKNKKLTAETTAMTIWVIITKLVNLGYDLVDTAKVENKLSNLKIRNFERAFNNYQQNLGYPIKHISSKLNMTLPFLDQLSCI